MRRRIRRPRPSRVALALALAASPVGATAPRATPPTDGRAERPGSAAPAVTGTVRDAAGRPLANVDVALPALQRQTTTDDAGRFVFRGVPAGSYVVAAFAIGYAPARLPVTVPADGADLDVALVLRPASVRLGTVQITATPTGTDPQRLAQSALDLSGRALERSLGASVAQTLAREPGLAQRFNGAAATMPVIRGLTGERILVLQDGQRAGDLASAAADHAVTIDPLVAQRVEVVRGPASLLYGTQALGGVVNVISNDIPTQVPTHVQGSLATQTESVSPGAAGSLGLVAPLGERLALSVRGTARSAADLRIGGGAGPFPNTFQHTQSGVAGLGYVARNASGGLVWRGSRFDYGLPAALASDEAGTRIDGGRQELVGRTDLAFGARGVTRLRLNGTAQWYHHDEVEPDGAIGTRFDLRTQTLDALARTQLGRVRGAVGAQGLLRQYRSSGEEALTPPANTTNVGLFVFQELPLGRAGGDSARTPTLQAGARVDRFRIASRAADARFGPGRTTAFTAVSGSLGLNAPLGRLATFGVSAARAFRAPTVEELYSNAFHAAVGTYDVGTPALRPEINRGIDAVLRVQADSGRLSGSLSAYANRIAGLITPTIVGLVDPTTGAASTGPTAVPLNRFGQRDASLRGVEGELEATLRPRLVAGVMGDLVRGTLAGGDAVPFLPPARLGASLRWEGPRLTLGGDVRRAFAQSRTSQPTCGVAGDGAEAPDAVPGSGGIPCVDLATGAYTVVNLSAGWQFLVGGQLHALTLRADNVGDVRYWDAASRVKRFVANPGRNVSLVYKLLF